MCPKRGDWVDGILKPCLRNKAEEQTVLAQGNRLRRAQSCPQAAKGLSLRRGNELAVWPQGVNCQDQAVEFWTGEIQKGTEDSINKGYLKEDTRGQWQSSWHERGPSKAPWNLHLQARAEAG